MLDRIKQYIESESLIQKGDHLLLGISGGVDSIALLHLFHELKNEYQLALSVVHINHGLRSKSADKDQQFVSEQCAELGIPFYPRSVDTKARAAAEGWSIEMAARTLRREAFLEVLEQSTASKVVLAHHMNDQAETLLLRIARGTSVKGMGGIKPKNNINGLQLIRPLLNIKRSQLLKYVKKKKLTWREDKSNQELHFHRNKVRKLILPVLKKEINAKSVEHLSELSASMREDEDYIRLLMKSVEDSYLDGSGLNLDALKLQHPAIIKRALVDWLLDQQIPPEKINHRLLTSLINIESRISVSKNKDVLLTEGRLSVLEVAQALDYHYDILMTGTLHIKEAGLNLESTKANGREATPHKPIGEFPQFAYIAVKDGVNLTLRNWRKGDRLKLHGTDGRKKLQDIFTDAKLPKEERWKWPIIAVGDDVVWVPGYQVAEPYLVHSDTECSLFLKIDRCS